MEAFSYYADITLMRMVVCLAPVRVCRFRYFHALEYLKISSDYLNGEQKQCIDLFTEHYFGAAIVPTGLCEICMTLQKALLRVCNGNFDDLVVLNYQTVCTCEDKGAETV